MEENVRIKETRIYSAIRELKIGDDSDRILARKCMGILGNDSTEEPFEGKLDIIEEMIEDHLQEKNQTNKNSNK